MKSARTYFVASVGLAVFASALDLAACGSNDTKTSPVDSGSEASNDASDAAVIPSPIRHIVVILKENRTFENYFTGFPGADTSTQATLSNGTVITRPDAPDTSACGITHTYKHAIEAYDQGKLDQFDLSQVNCADGGEPERPFYQFAESQIPNYWQYARNFALSDHFFSTVNGPSTPGHLAILAGWSPAYENPLFCLDSATCGCIAPTGTTIPVFDPKTCALSSVYPCFDIPSIADAIPPSFTWMAYGMGKGSYSESTFNFVKSIGSDANVRAAHSRDLTQFTADMGTDQQANLVYAFVGSSPIDEAPGENPCAGENYTVQVVNQIMQSPIWKDSLIMVTWDDWGGNFDHVVPPVELCPDGKTFFGPGFRLPILLISPYAKQAVLHTPTEQASIPKLIEDLWGMPRMSAREPNARDEKAGSLMEGLDFTQTARAPLMLTPRASCP